jgi:predicted phosphodiesterase
MRIAVVSDIHGNFTAFEAVLRSLRESAPDLVLHGGDLAEGGSRPVEVIDNIRSLGWQGVVGNTDEVLWAPERLEEIAIKVPTLHSLMTCIGEIVAATCEWLGEDRIAWLRTLPQVKHSGQLALVHAAPNDLWRAPLATASDAELESVYSVLGARIAVYGHIHTPFVRQCGRVTVANSGSVGMPYDGDTRASYLLLDGPHVSIQRVEYEIDEECRVLQQSGLPHASWVAQLLRGGRYTPLKTPGRGQ